MTQVRIQCQAVPLEALRGEPGPNISIDTDPQQQEAASPHSLRSGRLRR
jgi:hypothetical protein